MRDRSENRAYTDIVDALLPNAADLETDCEELWRRIALNILITNMDDCLANMVFLHVEKGKWRLSSAFDLSPFPDEERTLKTGILDASGDAASVEALMEAAECFRLRPSRCRQVLGEVETIVARWRDIGQELIMSDRGLKALEPAFEHSEREITPL